MARTYAIAGHKQRAVWALGLLGVSGVRWYITAFCLGCLHFYRDS
jgi:hypothetical protein